MIENQAFYKNLETGLKVKPLLDNFKTVIRCLALTESPGRIGTVKIIKNSCLMSEIVTPDPYTTGNPKSLTLRQGLEKYYRANPNFVQNQDLWVGRIRIPWRDLQRHDIMHVVTGYNTTLDQELRLIGFLLSALTWRRPWYYYAQSFFVFLELLWQSLRGKSWGATYYNPLQVWQFYWQGVAQGGTVRKKIDAYIDANTVMDRGLNSLRQEYGIQNAGTWDS